MKRVLEVIAMPVILICIPSCGGSGLIGALGGTAIAGMTVKSALERFEGIVNSTLATASTEGDAKIARAGNQLEVATKNLSILFDGKYDKAISDLKQAEQELFVHLIELEKEIKSGENTIRRTRELLNLDMIEFTNRIRFVTEKVPFYISSINGITVRQTDEQHELEIVGIGFGYGGDGSVQSATLLIDNQSLPVTAYRRRSDKEFVATVPKSMLESHFQANKMSFVKAIFQVKSRGNSLFSKDGMFSVDFLISILPKYAGRITVSESVLELQRGPKHDYPLVKNVIASSPNRPNDWSQEWTCPENCVIDSVEYKCDGGGCGWCYNPAGGHAANYTISNGGRTVVARRHCDGPACTVTHQIHYTEMVKVPTIVKKQAIDIEFGKQLVIKLEAKNERHEFKVEGKTYLGQDIYVDNNSISRPVGPIKFISGGEFAGVYEARFSVEE